MPDILNYITSFLSTIVLHLEMADKNWKTQPPYQEPDQNFNKALEGACHCGRVKYWLSQDKPLASKYCHCGDCKVIHGKASPRLINPCASPHYIMLPNRLTPSNRCPFPMGSNIPKVRYGVPERHRKPALLQLRVTVTRTRTTLQSELLSLRHPHYG